MIGPAPKAGVDGVAATLAGICLVTGAHLFGAPLHHTADVLALISPGALIDRDEGLSPGPGDLLEAGVDAV